MFICVLKSVNNYTDAFLLDVSKGLPEKKERKIEKQYTNK